MTYITVQCDRREYTTRSGDPNDRWDRDDTAAVITVHGIEVSDKQNYRDLVVPFDVVEGKTYYLLWADYDTGDSFGRDCNRCEWLDLFETKAKADEAAKSLLKATEFSGSYKREDGSTISISIPWNGYFESLNELIVEPVSVGARSSYRKEY